MQTSRSSSSGVMTIKSEQKSRRVLCGSVVVPLEPSNPNRWKTLVHTSSTSPQQRRGRPVPQELQDRVLAMFVCLSVG
ncbi:hypothetical protein ARALYDRAFT_920427 [Arabidopsis lyrata subsp. lyrata]|uniref:Uncharacterized protein n=1 Tax=Arabidopsis lyrata subsp. lyrata TaxID=81972 RepID=D7MX22_ARALL|nr:hypothetical protein ARALYDRAFT_920427 [Arabidopsis lyrata subsp. lyrata]